MPRSTNESKNVQRLGSIGNLYFNYLTNFRGYADSSAQKCLKHLSNFDIHLEEQDFRGTTQERLNDATPTQVEDFLKAQIGKKSLDYGRHAATGLRRFYEANLLENASIHAVDIKVPLPASPRLFNFEIVADWATSSYNHKRTQANARSMARRFLQDIGSYRDLPLVESDEITGYARIKSFVAEHNFPPSLALYPKLNRYSITEIFCLNTLQEVNLFLARLNEQIGHQSGRDSRFIKTKVSYAIKFLRNLVQYCFEQNLTETKPNELKNPFQTG